LDWPSQLAFAHYQPEVVMDRRLIRCLGAGFVFSLAVCNSVAWAQSPAPPATAPVRQRVELGVSAGVGPFHYGDGLQPGNRNVGSVSACLACGRRGLVLEYSRWSTPRASYATQYRSADTVTAGVRWQRQGRVRPFVDAGLAVGHARWSTSGITTVGGFGGAGITIVTGERLFVRAGARLLLMSQYYVGATITAGGGLRF
jgi:hypothetical protein